MVQRPPDDDDPTAEEEAPEFDGSGTDQLDDTYRSQIAVSSEGSAVGFDDRGQSQWKSEAELAPNASNATGTFDQIKALDNPAPSLEEEPVPEPPRKTGYDPYATGVFEKQKTRR